MPEETSTGKIIFPIRVSGSMKKEGWFTRPTNTTGVMVRLAVLKSSNQTVVQAYIFDTTQGWTMASAKKWLKENDVKWIAVLNDSNDDFNGQCLKIDVIQMVVSSDDAPELNKVVVSEDEKPKPKDEEDDEDKKPKPKDKDKEDDDEEDEMKKKDKDKNGDDMKKKITVKTPKKKIETKMSSVRTPLLNGCGDAGGGSSGGTDDEKKKRITIKTPKKKI